MSAARGISTAVLAVALAVVAGACTSGEDAGAPPTTAEPAPPTAAPTTSIPPPVELAVEVAPEDRVDFSLDVEAASAGDHVDAYFPLEHRRGVAFALDQWDGEAWVERFILISDGHGGTPRWIRIDGAVGEDVGDDHMGWLALPVFGPGPDRLVIPPTATPGAYRICADDSYRHGCVGLEIT